MFFLHLSALLLATTLPNWYCLCLCFTFWDFSPWSMLWDQGCDCNLFYFLAPQPQLSLAQQKEEEGTLTSLAFQ